MSELRGRCDEYLQLRRALGYKLVNEGRLLASFLIFAEQAGATSVTNELARRWTTLPTDASPIYLSRRMRVVRAFARYLRSIDPDTEIPPEDLFPTRNRRPTPVLYSEEDVIAVMAATKTLGPPLRAATMETFVGLLAATGMRGGEAMALDRADVDWDEAVLLVRDSKFGKTREVLVHGTTLDALRSYEAVRDSLCSRPASPSFFVSTRGTRLTHLTVQPAFREALTRAGLVARPGERGRTPHGLRHSFTVATLVGWYRDGGDVEARMPALSTHLGHADPRATYWYLSAVPELLGLAATLLERADEARP